MSSQPQRVLAGMVLQATANWFPVPVQQPAITGDTAWVALAGAMWHPGPVHALGMVHPSGMEHVPGVVHPPGPCNPPGPATPWVSAPPAQPGARPGLRLPLCRQTEVVAAHGSCGAGDLQRLVCVISIFFFVTNGSLFTLRFPA